MGMPRSVVRWLSSTILALGCALFPASAQESARPVRIRLVDRVSGAASVTVTATGAFRVRESATGPILAEGAGGMAFSVRCAGSAVTADLGSMSRRVGEISGSAGENLEGEDRAVELPSPSGAPDGEAIGSQARVVTAKTLRIESVAPEGALRARVGRREWLFPGALEFARGKRGLAVVNEAPLEQYLLGVVAAEGPASFHLEALKALAIAARSYTECNRGRHGGGSDLCDGTHCHAYGGIGRVAARVREAVESTTGIVALHNGRPIDACYSADCGGRTQSPDDAWGPRRNPIPYLRSVPDAPVEGGREYCSVNPKHAWRATLALETLRRRLGLRSDEIQEVGVAATSGSGRVRVVRVVSGADRLAALSRRPQALASRGIPRSADRSLPGADDEEDEPLPCEVAEEERPPTHDNEFRPTTDHQEPGARSQEPPSSRELKLSEFRKLFAPRGLPGSYFRLSVQGNEVVVEGSGLGHGVGLCQFGAHGMALKGHTCEEILKHYYTGIEIGSLGGDARRQAPLYGGTGGPAPRH
jgi:stage II sporulation protein D